MTQAEGGGVVGGVAVLGAQVRGAGDQRLAQEREQQFPGIRGGGVLQGDGVVDAVARPAVELLRLVRGDRPVLAEHLEHDVDPAVEVDGHVLEAVADAGVVGKVGEAAFPVAVGGQR